MNHPLDRAVWNALNTRLSSFTTPDSNANAVRIDPEVGVFLACADDLPDSVAALGELARTYPGSGLIEVEGAPIADVLPDGVSVAGRIPLVQMRAQALTGGGPSITYEILTEADAPAMLALATLTRPGPFRSATRKLGPFIGVKQDGALIAMAGRRLRVDGFTELSGVCTRPDHRGKGLAAALSRAVVADILASGETAFLHAFADHSATITFYHQLGFEVRARMTYTVLTD
ncbi:GNAT family N-acetyltransferase [Brevundimonas sp. SORGH_AS_0993]|uniref:GNAT family N-acetyltransferase n=1 Tax=Brevundimonas sp. SORGH_AS_0993 TaxID=3041794 RepID=UPI002781ED61|nr:GNAT family N-acetyltransferase [Brevundimonas sp. SORGH_AS_0993]MDQ1154913.1 ribosomal protein S18 acetylase RimI-like enzyme [Brevundimonas sp. SORGH_AS_0993]